MAASYSDMSLLGLNATFQSRVGAALVLGCISVANEGWAVPFHRERASYVAQILNSPSTFVPLFSGSVATDTAVIADATQAGTVVLTSGNVAAQAALVTDAHILSALAAQFNCFFRVPQ